MPHQVERIQDPMASFQSSGTPILIDQHEPAAAGKHPAILLLHGSGGNIAFWTERLAPQASRLNIALYAVHYFDRTATRRADAATILDGVHFPQWLATIADALAYIRARPCVDPARVALLGISLGAFLALSTGANPEGRVRAIVEVSGGLPEMDRPRVTRQFPPTLILHGDADTIVPVAQAHTLQAILAQAGVPHQTSIYPGQGHWFDAGTQLRIMADMAGFLGRYL